MLVNDRECLRIVFGQFDFLPELFGQVSTLYRFEVKVTVALVLTNSRIARISQRTAMSVAETCEVVIIATKRLRCCLCFEGTVTIVDHFPYNIVLNHL